MTFYNGNHGDLGPGQRGRRDPTKPTGSSKIPKQPANPYARDQSSGENPEVDDITKGDEAQKHREQMQHQDKAEGDR